MKRSSQITALPDAELQQRLDELRRELIKLNAQVATGTVPKNPGQIRQTRRTVARIRTVQRQRILAGAPGKVNA